uniref:Uncharacterized protein n=1 Tax=Panagrolaimus sp. JU765 TaxID=591449 RepID=A0AC34R4A0_9BILA
MALVQNEAGKVGFVPSNFVRKESFVDKAKGTIKGLGKTNGKNSTSNGKVVFGDQNGSSSHLPQTSRMAETTYAVAKYNYEPQRQDELQLTRGESVLVLERSSDGWWKGEINGRTGWFPSNYVDPVNAPSNGTMATEPYPADYATDYNVEATGYGGSQTVLDVVTTLYDFDAQNAEELSFRRGEKLDIIEKPVHDPEWWRARNAAGQIGLVPTNYIKAGDSGPATTASNGLTGPYANKDWYYGLISRHQSEQLLNQRGKEGDFLVRDSETNVGDYSITMKGNLRNMHFLVVVDRQQGTFKIGNRSFSSMDQLISHYMTSPIFNDDSTREKLFLIRPLPRY